MAIERKTIAMEVLLAAISIIKFPISLEAHQMQIVIH
jgi:hypothetical protein